MKKLEGLGPFGGNFLEEAINREKGILEFQSDGEASWSREVDQSSHGKAQLGKRWEVCSRSGESASFGPSERMRDYEPRQVDWRWL